MPGFFAGSAQRTRHRFICEIIFLLSKIILLMPQLPCMRLNMKTVKLRSYAGVQSIPALTFLNDFHVIICDLALKAFGQQPDKAHFNCPQRKEFSIIIGTK